MRLTIVILGHPFIDILLTEGTGPDDPDDPDQPYLDSESHLSHDTTPTPYGFRPNADPVPFEHH